MNVFERIEKALEEKDKTSNVLKFGAYTIIDRAKKPSQQGMVVIVENNIHKKFAIKFYRPTDTDVNILKDSIERFVREIKMLATLTHKNIVKVYTGGKAIRDEKNNKWNVDEGLDNVGLSLDENEVLYYVMDFIEGEDISSIFPELRKNKSEAEEIPLYERLRLFEGKISQLTRAMNYYHSKNITHKDIKPDNIRYSMEDSTFIIVDFGFARYITSPQDYSTIIRTEYLDLPSIEAQNYESNDLAQFAHILLKILPSFKSEYDVNRYQGIESALNKATHPKLEKRYKTPLEFYNSIKQYFLTLSEWSFQLKSNEYLCPNRFGKFSIKLRIPISDSILLPEEVREIVDTPEFQRLRGVRQLGPTIFVFPGANHTRFEHSLGVYFLSLKYLEGLLGLPLFREICEPLDETIKLIVLSSLLHDIGHYPYSHWVEEIGEFHDVKFPSHEDRARQILSRGSITTLIEERWKVNIKTLANIIVGTPLREKRNILVNSFINSPIDVDKVDYLIRDSIHCGVNYGKGIDVERLLGSLYVDPSLNKICLTDKGRSCLFSILGCRNIMYQEVYWHKTVQACSAMFKRFFYEYLSKGIDNFDTIKSYFEYTDDRFISNLFEKSKEYNELNKLISPFVFKGRLLYKPAYIFSKSNVSEEPHNTREFFIRILENSSYERLVNVSNKLAEKLKDYIPKIKPLDILIETAPIKAEHEIYKLDGFKIWDIRKGRFGAYPKGTDALNEYLRDNVQAYIFCNPSYYEDIKKLRNKLEDILGELIVQL